MEKSKPSSKIVVVRVNGRGLSNWPRNWKLVHHPIMVRILFCLIRFYDWFNVLNWNNIQRFSFVECLSNFLVGEGKLESYLEEHPPIESNFTKAKSGLQEAKNYLNLVTGESGRRAGIALDAHLLLAKLFYACGQYEDSLENFVKAELNSLSEKELTL